MFTRFVSTPTVRRETETAAAQADCSKTAPDVAD
jgi:hypothetical protein